jgi:hypothetical protein
MSASIRARTEIPVLRPFNQVEDIGHHGSTVRQCRQQSASRQGGKSVQFSKRADQRARIGNRIR